MKIAIPSMPPGGLEAQVAGHFGHSKIFTIVTLQDTQPVEVAVVENAHLTGGSCGTLVQQLVGAGIQAVIVGGIGMRPLEMLQARGVGIFSTRAATVRVRDAVEAFLREELPRFDSSDACSGGGKCRHH